MTERQNTGQPRIPRFDSPEEAGEFWDNHSPEDFPEEFREVQVQFSRPLIKRGLTIKLDDETIKKLRSIARDKGIGPSTLVRMWIFEHLQRELAR